MNITVETFLKAQPGDSSEPVGPSRLTLDDSAYQNLLKLEQQLMESDSPELVIPARRVDVDAPAGVGPLDAPQMRVFLDPSKDAAHFHLVARRGSDGALVYTEPTMIRMLAV
ncbi:hypothetical protein DWB85_10770 [Seongchinamella sediminis]|uniref:Uncharacterized protein n=1 Tax=Seongchinamella sediminis TaxID=2283635 RepID=A0A3L7E0W4_9GAMM|nr:hypothetical protein [Seongchinamella sediminis]RLQ21762.1 hypothetical protein DWB85_10770 [Seongchinamella sediminis]